MYGYILILIGGYLVIEDLIKAQQAKKLLKEGGADENVLKNGTGGISGGRSRKSDTASTEVDRGRVIGIPVKKKGVNENELFEKPVQQVKLDTPGDRFRDDRSSQSDAASSGSDSEGVIPPDSGLSATEGQNNAGNENNLENGSGNDGNNVDG